MSESTNEASNEDFMNDSSSSSDADSIGEEPYGPYGPLLRREPYQRRRVREHPPPDVDDVVDTISPSDLTGTSPEERAKKIVSWLNWNLRVDEFAPDFRSRIWWEAMQSMEADERWSEVPGSTSLAWPTRFIDELKSGLSPAPDIREYFPELQVPKADDFIRGFEHYRDQWKQRSDRNKLRAILAGASLPATIDKVVCFGLGSPLGKKRWLDANLAGSAALEPVTRAIHRDGFTQLAVALETVRCLEEMMMTGHHYPVRVYVQDPDYSAEDERALERLGVRILDGAYGVHEGFVTVDESALVYDCILSLSAVRMVVPYVRPAAIMCPWVDPRGDQPDNKSITLRHGDWNNGEDVLISTPVSLTRLWVPPRATADTLHREYKEISLIAGNEELPAAYTEGKDRYLQRVSDYDEHVESLTQALMDEGDSRETAEEKAKHQVTHPDFMEIDNVAGHAWMALYVRKGD